LVTPADSCTCRCSAPADVLKAGAEATSHVQHGLTAALATSILTHVILIRRQQQRLLGAAPPQLASLLVLHSQCTVVQILRGMSHALLCQHWVLSILHSTAQHSTAQHSTAQHSTAQHSTAQHSTAQHSAVQRIAGWCSTAQHNAEQYIAKERSTTQRLQHKAGQQSAAQHSTA